MTLCQFLSTPPAWGATIRPVRDRRTLDHFYPRPPHGERLAAHRVSLAGTEFLSTPPAWGATPGKEPVLRAIYISIHAPRMGSDC